MLSKTRLLIAAPVLAAGLLAAAPAAKADWYRGGYGPRYGHYHRGPGPGAIIGGALLGIGAGALIAGALAPPPPVYYAPPPPAYYPPPPAYYAPPPPAYAPAYYYPRY